MSAYTMGMIFGSLVSGAIIGAIPAISGAVKGKLNLALGGFFACIVASFILGLFLSVPVCAIFMYLIFKKDKTEEKNKNEDEFLTEEKK
jgi:uncharacterized membrane protein